MRARFAVDDSTPSPATASFAPSPAERQDSQPEYLANQQVDDLEQHPASQP
jgi:hypothetical protein